MPLIMDNLLVFLWRFLVDALRSFRCRNWPQVTGKIENIDSPDRTMYPYVEIHFSYKVGGQEYENRRLKGFWWSSSARYFADEYAKLRTVSVRYSPDHPSASYVLDSDQVVQREEETEG